MDALTHAVEVYIGYHNNPFVKKMSEEATRLIFENLSKVYRDSSLITERENMLRASYCGGAAFTRASVGYVHAIAHNLGGLYGVPHGLANAVVLPLVFKFSRESCDRKLAGLAVAGGLGTRAESDGNPAARFIEKVKELNENTGIPKTISGLKAADISLIAKRAIAESNPSYPVPKIMNREQCEGLIRLLLS